MTTEEYVRETGKSRITSFLLTLFLGPLGLLYSSVIGGVIMIIIAISLSVTGVIGAIIIWILSIIMGDSFTYNYNKRLLAQSNFMKDISSTTSKSDNIISTQENGEVSIQENGDDFKISFQIKDENSWKNTKAKLWTFYKKHNIDKIISDHEKSWFIKGKEGTEGYIKATLTNENIITIESFKLPKPDTSIIYSESKQKYEEKITQAGNSTDKLIELGKLFEKELISKEEFEEEKKKILVS